MPNYNKTILAGHLTRDPELRYLADGKPVGSFTVAVSEKWKKDGELRETVSFIDCTAWGKQAEVIAQYLKKGSAALVEGKLRQDRWEDKETGKKRSTLKVDVQAVQFLGKRSDSADAPQGEEESSGQETGEKEPF